MTLGVCRRQLERSQSDGVEARDLLTSGVEQKAPEVRLWSQFTDKYYPAGMKLVFISYEAPLATIAFQIPTKPNLRL